ncbi:YbgC/FadM family acyl-CoA thioesterase [Roseomonas sp. NAR14]|uniref:YbgC/FadM family acyl-CoA thioesterase n=1 Tax=Roseomonas acroporae TaxID=2937791 RepID=A0A9X1YFQ7_9PROT|nr:YbgC/FadM family acyl-CoA thioesterase [Roseomonas acroporae]MCK8785401.1 YbgC/FadM family acyl-CoA thioesterase [Roseomonas acroporae]
MQAHRFPLRVYFEDTDAGGVVYHANYLRFAERARTECLRALGLPHQAMIDRHASILVVQRLEVEYLRPARLDDALVVETTLTRVRGASLSLRQAIRRVPDEGDAPDSAAGPPAAVLRVDLACIGRDSLRPVPLPEPWRSALRALVVPA